MGDFANKLKKLMAAGRAAKDVVTGKVEYSRTNVPQFHEMKEDEQLEFLLKAFDRDCISAIQCLSLIYRNPVLKRQVAAALREEILKTNHDAAKS